MWVGYGRKAQSRHAGLGPSKQSILEHCQVLGRGAEDSDDESCGIGFLGNLPVQEYRQTKNAESVTWRGAFNNRADR